MDAIRAVVVVGEVPRAAIAKLEDLLQRTLKLDHLRMLNDIDAALVKSYGAASIALHTEVNPGAYNVFVSPPLEEVHSEL
jgi:protein involved in polysaccharide export with SLBB domain